MKKPVTSALILFLAASDAYADELVMQRFTQSMSALYETAMLCEYALSPSPVSYARAISNYMETYYTNADSTYWALPVVDLRAKDPHYCKTRLQQGLMRYATARNDFAQTYGDYPLPPQLAMVKSTPVRSVTTVVRRNTAPSAPARFQRKAVGTVSGY